MKYFKSSQPVPGKGFAWTFYECDDDRRIQRYLTFFTETGEVKRVSDPVIKDLYDSSSLLDSSLEEFELHWPERHRAPAHAIPEDGDNGHEHRERSSGGLQVFSPDMTIGEAMSMHPRVAEVFAAFHLGGCSSCGISQVETVGQVCMAYGVDVDTLLEVLESLVNKTKEAEVTP